MKIITKIILAALYVGCLLNMPYSYYQIIRFASLIGYSYLIYATLEGKNSNFFIIPMIGLILFNPIEKITFKRDIWHVIDILFAVVLIVWAIIEIILILKHGKEKRTIN